MFNQIVSFKGLLKQVAEANHCSRDYLETSTRIVTVSHNTNLHSTFTAKPTVTITSNANASTFFVVQRLTTVLNIPPSCHRILVITLCSAKECVDAVSRPYCLAREMRVALPV